MSRKPPRSTSAPDDEQVTCFVSGDLILKRDAVLVPIAPGQRVWMRPEFCNDDTKRARAS